jgi:uncharacterized OB-fold protein/acyl dehydratase
MSRIEGGAPPELDDELRSFVGTTGPPTKGRHPVNEPMIAHWCDAMGDMNPCYTDESFARTAGYPGLVAPPAMLDVWDRPGLTFARDGASPRTGLLSTLFSRGFDSIVAVNTELDFTRYLQPGELISSTEVVQDISPTKRTSRGPGHFLTTGHRYTNQEGEHVGDLSFRILVFRPESAASQPPEADGAPTPPASDPALRPPPAVNQDNAFFWEGCRRRQLRIQKCLGCQALLSPPGPGCPHCGSFDMSWMVAAGKGSLYSFAVPEYPQVPGFEYPLCVGLVELEEGVRLVSDIAGLAPEQLQVGMPLQLDWLTTGGSAWPQFRAPDSMARPDTAAPEELPAGHELPARSLPITPTLVVAGAIATRDYTPVHHDVAIAQREGSKDIFMNINTTVGLVQRVVTDWVGPGGRFTSFKLRLGAPAYPGDLLTFSGQVTRSEAATGNVTIAVKAADSYGDHAVATVDLVVPTGAT